MEIKINPYSQDTQLVGIIPQCITSYYAISCNSYKVYMPPGVLKHLKRRDHWEDFLAYYQDIPTMISEPDYAGQNPKEPNSVELYKVMGDHILLAIKLNPSTELFLGSFYTLNNGESKIEARLKIGRIFPFSDFK